ncbi:MAG TPA: carboxylesterase family protein [Acetobacteraceae bacterium]|jgi:para-nitrobenzyl esterase|nr:carboxylesterase family protein [Acetobacteraceae bacterium]
MNDQPMTTTQPIVDTATGRVRGSLIEGVAAFKTIPYGAPTSGPNRFMPPRPPAPWAAIRDTLDYTGHAPQQGLRPPSRPELADFSGAPDTSPETEDCLTLNVWSPSLDSAAKKPVMVWFHGGAFSYGTANAPRLQGSRLAKRGDVVVVTVNQRLNIFGFLDLSHIGGNAFAASGNAGTLDMIAALQWVQENIDRFGGDPNNVTIFGESGGGGKVCTLLAMPLARGLFHRAIVQSGAVVRLREPERAARLTEAVLRTLNLTRDSLQELQALPMTQLLAAVDPAQKALGPAPLPLFDRYPFGPVVDGHIVPHHPFDSGAPDVSGHIPLMIGDMKDEMASFLARDDKVWHRTLTEEEMRERIAAVAGTGVNRVIETYRRLYPAMNPAERLIATLTDSNFRIRSLMVAEQKAKQAKAPIYMYSFEWETPVQGGRLKAPHALDVPFTFDTIDLTNATDRSAAAHTLSATMAETWAAFAHSGVPAHRTIPNWPAYDLKSRATMMLDAEWRVENDPRGETRQLWQTITAR